MDRTCLICLWIVSVLLTGCHSPPRRPAVPSTPSTTSSSSIPPSHIPPGPSRPPQVSPYPPAQEDPNKRGNYLAGGRYAPQIQDRAPDGSIDVGAIPEPVVVDLPRSAYGNRSPYQVLGSTYHVLDDVSGFVEIGIASYYGSKFHGRRTSNQDVYDMYAFTAAHKSLPLPSFARVTNLDNGKSVVVRVNDRGPFHAGRVIDLSYAAAVKIGIERTGTGRVEVRVLTPEIIATAASPMDAWVAEYAAAGPAHTNVALGTDVLLLPSASSHQRPEPSCKELECQ